MTLSAHHQADIAAVETIALVPMLLETVCHLSGMSFAAIARVTEGDWFACSVHDQAAWGLGVGDRLDITTTFCDKIRETREPVVIDDVETDAVYCDHPSPRQYGFKSYISVPIVLPDGTFFGTLCAFDAHARQVSGLSVLAPIRLFAALLGLHIDAARQAAQHRITSQSEAFLQAVLAASPDCVKVIGARDELEFMSERGVELNELPSVDVVLGREYATLWPSDEQANIRAALAHARTGAVGRTEGFCPTAKGTPRWFEVSFAPFEPDAGPGSRLVGISRDISERVKARQAEKASATRLQEMNAILSWEVTQRTAERDLFATIVESTDVLVLVSDLDFNILAINSANVDAFERAYGVRPKQGENMLELLTDQPEHRAQVEAGWRRALAGEETTFVAAFGNPLHDRSNYEVKFRTLRDGDGRRVGAYQFAMDVSARLLEQERLEKAEEALRQAQKMDAIGQLTGGIAHDFNNLLAGISGAMELLHVRLHRAGIQDFDRYVEAAQGAARRAAALTHRLLAFARRQTLNPRLTNINHLVAGMQEMIERTVGPAIRLRFATLALLPFVFVDGSQLENALLNLCINARDAMPDGGDVDIAAVNVTVDHACAGEPGITPGKYTVLSVRDTGCGMSRDVLERAFEPFFTTKPIGAGTGLGLSMIYGFAQQSGGGVTAVSAVGEGTVVKIYLPQHDHAETPEDDAQTAGPTTALVRAQPLEKMVLVVEDEPTVRMFVTELLTELGYTTIEAVDSAGGLEILRSDVRIDLLITDVGLPGGMTGWQMVQAMDTRRPDLKVIFMTGYTNWAAFEGRKQRPNTLLVIKPFTVEALSGHVRAMLEA